MRGSMHWFKMLFNSEYKKKYLVERKMRATHVSVELTLGLTNPEGETTRDVKYKIIATQNQMGDRDYKVLGSKFDIERYWDNTFWYREMEAWKHGSIMPKFMEDIIMKKLSQ